MPTEEFQPLLHRDLAKAEIRELLDEVNPVLIEIVNHACWAFQRCQLGCSAVENEDLAAFWLYRHLIELMDGIQVLASEACSISLQPLVRASFETYISLEYLLRDPEEYVRRSLAWLCVELHRRIEVSERHDPMTNKGKKFKQSFEKEICEWPPQKMPQKDVGSLRKILKTEQIRAINDEYLAIRAKKSRPSWYSLNGGPGNLRELSILLGKEIEYALFYHKWSTSVHAGGVFSYMTGTNDGQGAFFCLRSPQDLPELVVKAIYYMTNASRMMIDKFRSGEPGFQEWYNREIHDAYLHLVHLATTK